jgi:selenide,water dikinase
LNAETALIQTVDFFTPIVDDPFTFGAIATTNALSDVYAMGGTPLTALNISCFPSDNYPPDVLADVIAGGMSVLNRAGVSLLGGHTVKDSEFKFGVSVTGICHPDQILTNRAAHPGDVLVLTKPIGTGVFTTALKRGAITADDVVGVIESMLLLNNGPIEIGKELGIPSIVHAATDITGYGLLGHLSHWVRESNIGLSIKVSQVPFFDGLDHLVTQGCIPGGTYANADFSSTYVNGKQSISDHEWLSLNDPQTSGGLCLALDAAFADAFLSRMHAAGLSAWIIGDVTITQPGLITLVV